MLGEIQQTHPLQSPGAQLAQSPDVLAALDKIFPQLPLQCPRRLDRLRGALRESDHLGLPVAALIRLVFPVVKKSLLEVI